MPRVLVTGGAGFVGSNYVRALLSGAYPAWREADVTVLDRLTYAGDRANLEPVKERLVFVQGDICDEDLLADLVPGHDVVINFAAESHVDRSIADSSAFVRTNVLPVSITTACARPSAGTKPTATRGNRSSDRAPSRNPRRLDDQLSGDRWSRFHRLPPG
ncbi:GDP-mannose 4,6-dehydratase [Spongiactinospora sp. TRM90649]|uniref:GDP-mannose 4,6-dehydratase n=1 Tax=Spongiactinospora sp. TRM90649 TaxID=3031114 RepID=UPI00321192A6